MDEENVIYVPIETWNWLCELLEQPAKELPKLKELIERYSNESPIACHRC